VWRLAPAVQVRVTFESSAACPGQHCNQHHLAAGLSGSHTGKGLLRRPWRSWPCMALRMALRW
jgi:hypothetical protein